MLHSLCFVFEFFLRMQPLHPPMISPESRKNSLLRHKIKMADTGVPSSKIKNKTTKICYSRKKSFKRLF